MGVFYLDSCRSFLTGLLYFLITFLPSLFHTEDREKTQVRLSHVLHTLLQVLPIALSRRVGITISFHELKAMHFLAIVHVSNLTLDFSLFIYIFNISSSGQAYSWLMAATDLLFEARAQSAWKLACQEILSLNVAPFREVFLDHSILNVLTIQFLSLTYNFAFFIDLYNWTLSCFFVFLLNYLSLSSRT